MRKYGYKGTNNDYDTCEVCGKTNLNKVMWLVELDSDGGEIGEAFAVGTTCGAKLLGYSQKDFNKATRNAAEVLRHKQNYAERHHPLTVQADRERKEKRQAGLSIREIRKLPDYQRWTKMYNQAREEVQAQDFIVEL